MELTLVRLLIGPVIAEIIKGADADLAGLKATFEKDADGALSKLGIPATTVNATIDALFNDVTATVNKIGALL